LSIGRDNALRDAVEEFCRRRAKVDQFEGDSAGSYGLGHCVQQRGQMLVRTSNETGLNQSREQAMDKLVNNLLKEAVDLLAHELLLPLLATGPSVCGCSPGHPNSV